MIYIFKDEFKYVIETEGLDDSSMVIVVVIVTLDNGAGGEGQLVRVTSPTPRGSDLTSYFTTRRP